MVLMVGRAGCSLYCCKQQEPSLEVNCLVIAGPWYTSASLTMCACSGISLLSLQPVATLLQPSCMLGPVSFVMPAAQEQVEKVSGIYHPWHPVIKKQNKTFSHSSLVVLSPFPSLIVIIIKKLNAKCLAVSSITLVIKQHWVNGQSSSCNLFDKMNPEEYESVEERQIEQLG